MDKATKKIVTAVCIVIVMGIMGLTVADIVKEFHKQKVAERQQEAVIK